MQDTSIIEKRTMSHIKSDVDIALCKVLKSRKALGRRDLSPRTVARFHQKYTKSSGCWQWTAAKYPLGYGMVYLGYFGDGRRHITYAHRVAYVLGHGDIPAGPFVVMHTCDERACVNPAHLRLASQKENIHDGIAKGRIRLTIGRRQRAGVGQLSQRGEEHGVRSSAVTGGLFGVGDEFVQGSR
jgi:hypothetical protein